jgi:hypothetical protein
MASGSTAVSCHSHVSVMQFDYLQNLPGALYTGTPNWKQTASWTNYAKNSFLRRFIFCLQCIGTSGVPADWLVMRWDSTGLVSASARSSRKCKDLHSARNKLEPCSVVWQRRLSVELSHSVVLRFCSSSSGRHIVRQQPHKSAVLQSGRDAKRFLSLLRYITSLVSA